MPIRPENRARYPRDWPEISLRIRKVRAADRCECQGECGNEHAGRCPEINGQPHSITSSTVVLTVAHLDDTPENCSDENLRAMCQRCHLAYDRDTHIANLRETHSRRRLASLNNHELFDAELGMPTRPERIVTAAPISILPGWQFDGLAPHKYGVIVADPPWRFLNRTPAGEKKNPVAHYPCMTMMELAALPVARLAAPDCALIMWATAPLLHRAIELIDAWGFTFKSAGAWAKRSKTGERWTFGTGYILRSAAEFYLVATIGRPRVQSRSIRNLIEAPVREHSRKPDQLHADVEALYAGPYAELFARQRRDGWDSWGNQTELFEPDDRVASEE